MTRTRLEALAEEWMKGPPIPWETYPFGTSLADVAYMDGIKKGVELFANYLCKFGSIEDGDMLRADKADFLNELEEIDEQN